MQLCFSINQACDGQSPATGALNSVDMASIGLTRSKEVAMTEASLVMLMTMMAQVGISRPSRITEKKKKPRMSRLLAMR